MKGVERLKGTAKGIDLASFIAEYRSLPEFDTAETRQLSLQVPLGRLYGWDMFGPFEGTKPF